MSKKARIEEMEDLIVNCKINKDEIESFELIEKRFDMSGQYKKEFEKLQEDIFFKEWQFQRLLLRKEDCHEQER